MRSIPSWFLLFLTPPVKILHSFLLCKKTKVQILPVIDRGPVDRKVRSRGLVSVPFHPPDLSSLALARKREAPYSAFRAEVPFAYLVEAFVRSQVFIGIEGGMENEIVAWMGWMDVEEVRLEAGGAVAAVNFLVGSRWWIRGAERVWESEEDGVLRETAVAGAAAGLTGCHLERIELEKK